MKKFLLFWILMVFAHSVFSQSVKIEMYDLVKQFLYDSSGFENVGEWGIKQPKKYAATWKSDAIEMSPDTSINFYRLGTADVKIHGKTKMQKGVPVRWQLMLKGPRMGYTSFSIISTPSSELNPRFTLDSIFVDKPYTSKLLSSCDDKTLTGFYYYEVKIPKKDVTYLKVSWISVNGNTAIRVDGYDSYSRYAVKLDCPK